MKSLHNNSGLILTVILIVLAIFGYKTFFAGDITQNDVASNGVGKTVVDLYSGFQNVQLDTAIFSDSAYRSLVDFTVVGAQISNIPVGRNNPFDKITP